MDWLFRTRFSLINHQIILKLHNMELNENWNSGIFLYIYSLWIKLVQWTIGSKMINKLFRYYRKWENIMVCLEICIKVRYGQGDILTAMGLFTYYLIICDLKNLVPSGHKELWRPLAANKGSCNLKNIVAYGHNQL